ncbi:MAG: LysR family transcriptional regulator [Xanthobacteraceae bacterium]|nr:LysR family transcriptional regulator [Xanthobacteraceae bacterium]
MDVRQLRYFTRIVELGSLTRAAEALNISQPALGLQVRNLEGELQTQLLERRSRGVVPTAAGLLLVERARRIIAEVDDARQAMRDHAGTAGGEVTVGITPSTNAAFAARIIRRCAEEYPAIQLRIIEGLSSALVDWIRSARVDLAVVYYLDEPPFGLVAEPIAQEELFFVESSSIGKREATVTFEEVCRYPLIMPGAPHGLRLVVDQYARTYGHEFQVPFEMQSVPVILELIQLGLGCGILPYGAVAAKIASGDVRATRIVEPAIDRTMSLVYRQNRQLSKAELMLKALLIEQVAAATWRDGQLGVPRALATASLRGKPRR